MTVFGVACPGSGIGDQRRHQKLGLGAGSLALTPRSPVEVPKSCILTPGSGTAHINF